MIEFKEYKVINFDTFENFLVDKGVSNRRYIWEIFAEYAENDSYNWKDSDTMDNYLEDYEYDLENCEDEGDEERIEGIKEKIKIINLTKDLINKGEIPNGFLLNIYW